MALDTLYCKTTERGSSDSFSVALDSFLTNAETHYAIKLELLAVVYAMLKCKFYLTGLKH